MKEKIIAIKGEFLTEALHALKEIKYKGNLSEEALKLIIGLIKNYWVPEFKEEAWKEIKEKFPLDEFIVLL